MSSALDSPSRRQLPDLLSRRRLSPAQRRIAQFVLENAAEAAFLSSTDLAGRAGVSQPSVTRFAAALGFASYQDFRGALREQLLGNDAEPTDGLQTNALQDAVLHEAANLRKLAHALRDSTQIEAAAAELSASQPLVVLGLRVSAGVASHFAYCAQKVLPDVRVITSGDSTARDLLDQAALAGATHVLAFVLPRYPRETLEMMRYARERDLRVVAISDTQLEPVAGHADRVLAAAVGSRLVFDSHVVPEMLALVLLESISDHTRDRTQRRLERFEETTARHRVFQTA
ncbi:MAG: SIS domain-containing protein [Streptosporangiales bacterium]|nr:SIS domain-containing protein [Streptosporangiales bacterium]